MPYWQRVNNGAPRTYVCFAFELQSPLFRVLYLPAVIKQVIKNNKQDGMECGACLSEDVISYTSFDYDSLCDSINLVARVRI